MQYYIILYFFYAVPPSFYVMKNFILGLIQSKSLRFRHTKQQSQHVRKPTIDKQDDKRNLKNVVHLPEFLLDVEESWAGKFLVNFSNNVSYLPSFAAPQTKRVFSESTFTATSSI